VIEQLQNSIKIGKVARWILPSLGSFFPLLILYMLAINAHSFLNDSDTGWHIRAGDVMYQTNSILTKDVFSHTMTGREWFAWEWLSDILMSRIHAWWGPAGLVGVAITVIYLSFIGLYRLMHRNGADPLFSGILLVFGAWVSSSHWLARPHILSFGLMVIWFAIMESYRCRRSKSKRWLRLFGQLFIGIKCNLA